VLTFTPQSTSVSKINGGRSNLICAVLLPKTSIAVAAGRWACTLKYLEESVRFELTRPFYTPYSFSKAAPHPTGSIPIKNPQVFIDKGV